MSRRLKHGPGSIMGQLGSSQNILLASGTSQLQTIAEADSEDETTKGFNITLGRISNPGVSILDLPDGTIVKYHICFGQGGVQYEIIVANTHGKSFWVPGSWVRVSVNPSTIGANTLVNASVSPGRPGPRTYGAYDLTGDVPVNAGAANSFIWPVAPGTFSSLPAFCDWFVPLTKAAGDQWRITQHSFLVPAPPGTVLGQWEFTSGVADTSAKIPLLPSTVSVEFEYLGPTGAADLTIISGIEP